MRVQNLHCWMNDSVLRFLMLIIVVALVRWQLAWLLQSSCFLFFFWPGPGGGVLQIRDSDLCCACFLAFHSVISM